jgi:hypothetical protein
MPVVVCEIARRTGTLREWCWYDRIGKKYPARTRVYHVFSIDRVVTRDCHIWRVVIGPLAFGIGFKS